MNILKIAFRNLNRQKRRSVLLVIAIVFAFFIVTFIDGMSAGAMKSMEYQLAKVIGGHVYILKTEAKTIRQICFCVPSPSLWLKKPLKKPA